MVASCSSSESRLKLMAVAEQTRQPEPSLRITMSSVISWMSRWNWVLVLIVEMFGCWAAMGTVYRLRWNNYSYLLGMCVIRIH